MTEEVAPLIRAVMFDLDGTLRVSRPAWEENFIQLARQHGVQVDEATRRRLKRWAHRFWASSPELKQLLETHGHTEAFWLAYTRRRLEVLGCSPEQAAALAPTVFEALNALAEKVEDVVPPEVPPTLETLRRAGYRLALLTNRHEPLNGYLEKIGLAEYFDPVFVAGEVGVWKPDPGVFHHAVKTLQLPPSAVLYVGDNYYTDVLGAQAAGLQAVLLDPEGLFPEAPCPVIARLDQLPLLLEQWNGEHALAS